MSILRSRIPRRRLLKAGCLAALLIPCFVEAVEPGATAPQACEQALLSPVEEKLEQVKKLEAELKGKLGVFSDPFLFATNVERALKIWDALLKNFPELASVRDAVSTSLKENAPINENLEKRTIEKAKAVLSDPSPISDQVAGAIEALRKLELIYLRDRPVRETKSDESKNGKEPKEPAKKPEGQKEKESPPPAEYPDAIDRFRPNNKNTDHGEGDQQPRVSIARVNAPGVGYFKHSVYQVVNRNGAAKLEMSEPAQVRSSQGPTHSIWVKPLNKKGASLPVLIPQGFVPLALNTSQGRVWKDPTGNYWYQTQSEELEIPLFEQGRAARPLSPPEVEIYTSHTGYQLNEWPAHLQEAVHHLQSQAAGGRLSGRQIAELLTRYIASHFKYRVDEDQISELPALVQKGAFQCDSAAILLVSLLRNEFRIPSRPVGGFRGMAHPRDPNSSHVVVPSTQHAWVEVADEQGNWHEYDPTPFEKDRETKKETHQDDFKNIQSRSSDSGEEKESDASQGHAQGQDMTRGDEKDAGKKLEELIREVQTKQRKRNQDQRAKEEKSGNSGNSTEDSIWQDVNPSERLKLGEQDPIQSLLDEKNPLIQRLMMRSTQWALDETLSSGEKYDRINRLKGMLGSDQEHHVEAFRKMKSILKESHSIFTGDKPSFERWSDNLVNFAPRAGLNETASDLVRLQRQIDYTLQFMDHDERLVLQDLGRALSQVREALSSVKHKDSKLIQIARELYENLPGNISRSILKERFGLQNSLGADVGTLELAQAIVKNDDQMKDFRVSAILGPHTEFLVRPVQLVSRGEKRTWMRETLPKKRRKEILMTRDPRDRDHFVRLYNHLSDEEALARGEMGLLNQRKNIEYPMGTTDADPEKVSIFLIDKSGSMGKEKFYFQSIFVQAFVDRALSDVNPSGRVRHRVYILPFDGEPGEPIEVTSVDQAKAVMKEIRTKFGQADGGTNIQKVLLAGAKTVKAAEKRGDKALARATLILSSDGGSEVDAEVVKKAFRESSDNPEVELLFAFVAIGQTNPDLIELTSKDLGADKNMYLEWNMEDIQDVMAKATTEPKPINDFWTDKKWNELPHNVTQAFAQLSAAVGRYRVAVNKRVTEAKLLSQRAALQLDEILRRGDGRSSQGYDRDSVQEMAQLTQVLDGNREKKRPDSRVGQLKALRRALNILGPQLSAEERMGIMQGMFRAWRRLLLVAPEQLDQAEQGELYHTFFWPRYGEATDPKMKD